MPPTLQPLDAVRDDAVATSRGQAIDVTAVTTGAVAVIADLLDLDDVVFDGGDLAEAQGDEIAVGVGRLERRLIVHVEADGRPMALEEQAQRHAAGQVPEPGGSVF